MEEVASEGPEISVVAPAYNESEGIGELIREWISVLSEDGRSFEIVIADDGSTDGTSQALAALQEPRLKVLRSEKNHGYGFALHRALAAASGRYVVTIDSDGQFELRDYRGLLADLEAKGLDLVTGYRREKQDSWFKVMADRVLNLLVRLVFQVDLCDTNCALKVMRREVAAGVAIEAAGFPTPTEITVRAQAQGYRLGEGPVSHQPRRTGRSKLRTLSSGVQFILFLFYLKLQLVLRKRRVIQGEKDE